MVIDESMLVGRAFHAIRQEHAHIDSTQCLKKAVQNCFCHDFVKFPQFLIIILQNDGKEAKFMRGALILHLT